MPPMPPPQSSWSHEAGLPESEAKAESESKSESKAAETEASVGANLIHCPRECSDVHS
jgi:hypothetical protein